MTLLLLSATGFEAFCYFVEKSLLFLSRLRRNKFATISNRGSLNPQLRSLNIVMETVSAIFCCQYDGFLLQAPFSHV